MIIQVTIVIKKNIYIYTLIVGVSALGFSSVWFKLQLRVQGVGFWDMLGYLVRALLHKARFHEGPSSLRIFGVEMHSACGAYRF